LKRVALSFPLRPGPWQEIVRGVYRYAEPDRPWLLTLHNEEDVAVALAGNPDGVIAMVRTPQTAARLKAWGGPVVDTAHDLEEVPFARVVLDDDALGRVAADHLLALGRRSYGFVGNAATPAGRGMRRGFIEQLQRGGFGCAVPPAGLFDRPYEANTATARAAAEWLADLPRPAAVVAAHDALAHRLAEACRSAGLRVPEDVALLGCLNDEFLCTACVPPLSSVRIPGQALGHEAARVLDGMMGGAAPPARPIELPPLGVVARLSTDATAVTDPDLAAALRFLRDHAAEPIGVDEIVAASGLSRSSLERRFRAALGRGPLAELLRERVERARHLLTSTELSVKEVARLAGFRDVRHLCVTFRNKTGTSPARYRARCRPA
jgi:LacI family transcriptional regulator